MEKQRRLERPSTRMICRICEEEPATVAGLCATCSEIQFCLVMDLPDAEYREIQQYVEGGR